MPSANDPMLPSLSSASRSTARRRPSTSGNVNSLRSPKDAQSCVFKPPSPPSTPRRLNSPLEFQSSFRYRKKFGDCPRVFVILNKDINLTDKLFWTPRLTDHLANNPILVVPYRYELLPQQGDLSAVRVPIESLKFIFFAGTFQVVAKLGRV